MAHRHWTPDVVSKWTSPFWDFQTETFVGDPPTQGDAAKQPPDFTVNLYEDDEGDEILGEAALMRLPVGSDDEMVDLLKEGDEDLLRL